MSDPKPANLQKFAQEATGNEECAPCTCPCGCRAFTNFAAAALHPRLRKTVRCLVCSVRHSDPNLDADAVAEMHRANLQQAKEQWADMVPERFRTAVTSHPKILERIERVRAGHPAGILTAGPYGSGKTFMAYAYLNMLVAEGLASPGEILAGTENDLLGRISTASFQDRQKTLDRVLHPRWRFVLIDDIGWAKYTREDDRAALFHDVFDFLWSNKKTLLVTTNLTRENLKEWIGGASYDRMISLVGGEQVIVPVEESLRKRMEEQFERNWDEQQGAPFPSS